MKPCSSNFRTTGIALLLLAGAAVYGPNATGYETPETESATTTQASPPESSVRPMEQGRMGSGMVSPIEPLPFRSELERQRFKALTNELRCTVCQNESLAESTAPLARDLRMELFAMIQDNRSDMEIRQFMVDRYGDFVLYRPPLAGHTLLLWGGPLLLLLGGVIGAIVVIKRRREAL